MLLQRVLSWVVGLILASLLLAVAMQELLGPKPNAVFGLIALRSGIVQFEPIGRNITAWLQIAAVLLILGPRTRSLGAILGLVVSVAALLMHLTPWLGVLLPDPDSLTIALAHGATAAQIDAMGLPTDRGAMFLFTLAIAILCGLTILVERGRIHAVRPARRRARNVLADTAG